MKTVYFWVLVTVLGLSVTYTAFARPNDVHKVVAVQKSGKPEGKVQGPQKNGSCINGTTVHHKH
jgi:hypothetical protein